MTTPTVTINGKFWNMNQLSTAQETIEEGLLEAIGIKSDDIGKEGVMPPSAPTRIRSPTPLASD